MMEAKGPVKAEWNTSNEQGGAVEKHVMERKAAWSQFCKMAYEHILTLLVEGCFAVKSQFVIVYDI